MSTATHSSSGSGSKSESPKKASKSDIEGLIANSPVTSPVPAGLNDTRADGEPILGGFVEVTKGEHEGDYGVFLELQGTDAVLRLRDETGQRVVVPVTSLKASRAGKR